MIEGVDSIDLYWMRQNVCMFNESKVGDMHYNRSIMATSFGPFMVRMPTKM